jgi:hypothetical protein
MLVVLNAFKAWRAAGIPAVVGRGPSFRHLLDSDLTSCPKPLSILDFKSLGPSSHRVAVPYELTEDITVEAVIDSSFNQLSEFALLLRSTFHGRAALAAATGVRIESHFLITDLSSMAKYALPQARLTWRGTVSWDV